ncbi:carbamoyltransferase HypF [Blastococcus mobilis]|uniref:Carbamoyltransferase n=1 Tax=Blastococcus mobilis TaxID=1938746 RepID=A0A238ZDF1_9ACTN|nr:carbamoyltransferase HypF [Blastococcus mobilis]SNR81555.1 hydrogenase maturation protein HypF [Blastococcus mobilis]
MTVERRRIRVRGTVQGVGFRPFLYRQAVDLGLTGWVGNEGGDVVLEVEGDRSALDALLRSLRERQPPLAAVESVDVATVAPAGSAGFRIAASTAGSDPDLRVSADVAPCDACLAELADPDDRRFRYPFINCTNCGPRYTIVRAVPYDRPATTMAGFRMCPACQKEYDDPADRRFHAQPNACPDCGPRLAWTGPGEEVTGSAALTAAVARLTHGGTIALKSVGGYHLACDATDAGAVAHLRNRKGRPDKPFAIMVRDLAAAEALCDLAPAARTALTSPRRPVVLIPRRPDALGAVAAEIAPGLHELGVMLPPSPLHALLGADLDRPLVMTSGNLSDEPVVGDDDEARELLGPLVDGVLSHDRPIHVRTDDSVVRAAPGGRLQVVRRARGWVPQPVRLPVPADRPVLAVGAQLKNTVALARGGSVILSQHLGDLQHWPTAAAFQQAVEHLTRLARVEPAAVAHDLHPDYRSTAWARESGLSLVGVQHHHAHVASCLVEHGRTGPVLGIAFDGLGLGPDGSLWGGEFLLADLTGFDRVASLARAVLPGGDAAVREPWRTALSWVHRGLGEETAAELGPALDPRWAAVLSLVRSGRQPETSSVGRLFDAVAALLGVRARISYEGQAAVELEALARTGDATTAYPMGMAGDLLDPAPALRAVLAARAAGVPVADIAAGFHVGLATSAGQLAIRLADAHGVDTVALTGGVFQNVLLTDLLARHLRRAGLEVLLHKSLPCNDGGISAGQAAVAAAVLQGAREVTAVTHPQPEGRRSIRPEHDRSGGSLH